MGEVIEGGAGRSVSIAEGGGGGGGGGEGTLGFKLLAGGGGGGGKQSLAALETVGKVGTEGGGTAKPRLELHSTRRKQMFGHCE